MATADREIKLPTDRDSQSSEIDVLKRGATQLWVPRAQT
jgi:hypothetical protein